ncbi:NTP pyrophosphatase, house-cleaning of non-canonical NTPs [Andreprevotia lacus DSM 23236]|uniref:NTP pyrophosphatase, house-cleaning of non-canonical NTPs n=1 Tax=Andreprevotia lacus DSM 23236 TaxID=1121001 RepID=A0A1W1XQC7_9NEIS|nr:nucleotide pyrophosphohydrolase [Andreprevotia lacus]SMC26077.1 NTP pyrophosphatase, house-cleaning of non-canonical NTPs [Andreprevotia lacus DSM 23236]
MALDIVQLQQRLREFSAERDWDQFHTPKNLACALSVEAAELLELFQWLNDEQAQTAPQQPEFATRLGEEISDVLLYLLRLADVTGIDLAAVVERKIALNALKYPAEQARGHARKYDQL